MGVKITELSAFTALDAADLFVMVDDPAGAAQTKKITVTNFFKGIPVDIDLYGADLAVYSDAGSTRKITLDASTGVINFGANVGVGGTSEWISGTVWRNAHGPSGFGTFIELGSNSWVFKTGDYGSETTAATLSTTALDIAGNITLGGTVDGIDIATDVAANTTHISSDGTDHANVVTNDTHVAGDGSDHADVATNTTHSGGDGTDHTALIPNTLADAADDFLVADGDDSFVKKTLAETGAILEADLDHGNLQGLDTGADHSYIDQDVTNASSPTLDGANFTGIPDGGLDESYVNHTLADAASDFLVASGNDAFVKKTLAETGAILEADIDHGNIQGLDTGADHSYIDQDVTSGSSPTLDGANITGVGGYPLFGLAYQLNPDDSKSQWFGSSMPFTPVDFATTARVYVPFAGTITLSTVNWDNQYGTASTNENITVAIELNGGGTTTIATLGNTAKSKIFTNAGLSISVSAGDYIEWKITYPAWATNPTGVNLSAVAWVEY